MVYNFILMRHMYLINQYQIKQFFKQYHLIHLDPYFLIQLMYMKYLFKKMVYFLFFYILIFLLYKFIINFFMIFKNLLVFVNLQVQYLNHLFYYTFFYKKIYNIFFKKKFF